MKGKIDDIKKQKIFETFNNTQKRIRTIAAENDLTVEEVVQILEEFQSSKKQVVERKYRVISQELICKIDILRKQNKSLREISAETGISIPTIKKIYSDDFCAEDLFDEESVIKERERIYNLRKKGYTYRQIGREFGISEQKAKEKCVNIFAAKGEEIPKAIYKTIESIKIDETIFDMIQQGKKYREIEEYFESEGITMSISRIGQRYKETLRELAERILNLVMNNKVSVAEILLISEYCGMDLEKIMGLLE